MDGPLVDTRAGTAAPDGPPLDTSTASAQRQTVARGATRPDDPRDRCVHELVAAQAARAPDAPAVVAGERVLTYQELDRASNQLARHLRRLGIGPGTLVGVCLDRSTQYVVAALGALKAGGAFVPLDPAYPVARLTFMLNDAAAPVLLTQRCLAASLPAGHWRVIAVDRDWSLIASEDPGPLEGEGGATVADLAYVIYTSGSTGRPKGVQVGHDSLLNLIVWHQRAFGVTPADRATQLASPAFDASIWEVWPYLAAGASVH